MLSKSSLELPYECDKPLSHETKWVAFPLEIQTKGNSYASSLVKGREIISELEAVVGDIPASGFKLEYPVSNTPTEKSETVVVFRKINNENYAYIYHHVFISFIQDVDFWKKMQTTTTFLDAISNFSDKYTKDKLVNVQLGTRYIGSKL